MSQNGNMAISTHLEYFKACQYLNLETKYPFIFYIYFSPNWHKYPHSQLSMKSKFRHWGECTPGSQSSLTLVLTGLKPHTESVSSLSNAPQVESSKFLQTRNWRRKSTNCWYYLRAAHIKVKTQPKIKPLTSVYLHLLQNFWRHLKTLEMDFLEQLFQQDYHEGFLPIHLHCEHMQIHSQKYVHHYSSNPLVFHPHWRQNQELNYHLGKYL